MFLLASLARKRQLTSILEPSGSALLLPNTCTEVLFLVDEDTTIRWVATLWFSFFVGTELSRV